MAGNKNVTEAQISELAVTLVLLLECGNHGKHRKHRDLTDSRNSGNNNNHINNSKDLLGSLNCTVTQMQSQEHKCKACIRTLRTIKCA
jgi:hypothetical protein